MFTTAASTGEAMFRLRRPGYRANGRRGSPIALESANLEIDQLAIWYQRHRRADVPRVRRLRRRHRQRHLLAGPPGPRDLVEAMRHDKRDLGGQVGPGGKRRRGRPHGKRPRRARRAALYRGSGPRRGHRESRVFRARSRQPHHPRKLRRCHVQQPAAPEKRMSYTFRGGEWQEVGFHSTSPSPTFDIEDVDPAGIDATAGELNMSGAELSHVSVYADARVLSNPSPLPLKGLQQKFATAAEVNGSGEATRMTAPKHAGMEWIDPAHPSQTMRASYRGGWDAPDDRPTTTDRSFRLADLDAEMFAPSSPARLRRWGYRTGSRRTSSSRSTIPGCPRTPCTPRTTCTSPATSKSTTPASRCGCTPPADPAAPVARARPTRTGCKTCPFGCTTPGALRGRLFALIVVQVGGRCLGNRVFGTGQWRGGSVCGGPVSR